MTWAMDFHPLAEADRAAPTEPWLYRARLERAAEGFASSRARLFAPSGALAATSRQMYAVFPHPEDPALA